jgi:hypothetical protein
VEIAIYRFEIVLRVIERLLNQVSVRIVHELVRNINGHLRRM